MYRGFTLCPKDFRRKSVLGYGLYKYVTAVYTYDMNIVAHCRKVKTAVGLRNVAVHNSRETVYNENGRYLDGKPDWLSHPERARYNEFDGRGSTVLKRRNDRIKSANLARKPQKNAAAAVEFSISASPEWFEKNTNAKDQKQFFSDALDFLGEKYGVENVLAYGIHFDEKTPHMHVLMVPIVKTEKGFKYSSSEFLGGVKGLRDFQTEIAERVGKDRGLKRGVEGSTARHTDQKEWLAQRVKEIEKKETALEKREKRFEKTVAIFDESRKKRMRGWKMPAPKVLESAKAYRERVDPEVSGKIVRALKVVDENAFNVKYAKDEADRELGEQKRYTEMYKNQWQYAVKSADKYKAQYSELKSQILKAKSVDEINSIKEALTPKPTRDMGYER